MVNLNLRIPFRPQNAMGRTKTVLLFALLCGIAFLAIFRISEDRARQVAMNDLKDELVSYGWSSTIKEIKPSGLLATWWYPYEFQFAIDSPAAGAVVMVNRWGGTEIGVMRD